MKASSNAVLKVLGILLLVAAVLKGWQLLTEPVANSDIWSYRPFLILTVELELALAIWLLSGVFRKAAWLAGLLCFSFFSMITLYKAVTGAASCGCFGSVQINPWITLFAIDLPAVVALSMFRPAPGKPESVGNSRLRFSTAAMAVLLVGIPAGVAMATYKPTGLTSEGEIIGDSDFVVLEPKGWVGKRFPVLDYVSIGENLAEGEWITVFYYHGCPDCRELLPRIRGLLLEICARFDGLHVAFIETPPCNERMTEENAHDRFRWTKLSTSRFVITPTIVHISGGKVVAVWQKHVPNPEAISRIVTSNRRSKI